MSTSKKRVKSLRRRQPVTLDMIDQANVDIDFVESFIDLLSIVSEAEQLDSVRSRAITCMCSQSKIRIDAIKEFIRSLPGCTGVSP